MVVDRLLRQIKQQQSPAARLAYRLGKRAVRAEIPAPRAVYAPLYAAHLAVNSARHEVRQRLYYQPMFRAACASVGPRLLLTNGMPYLYGGLVIHIGRDCKINGHSAFAAGSLFESPTLTLGDETNIGYGVVISVQASVTLGSHVRVADGCYISDNPGHPLDMVARRNHQPVTPDQVKPVVIEDDVWLGTRVTILPGVRIGRGSVVGTGAVVTRDLAPMSLAVGNPARIVRTLNIPSTDGQIPASAE